MKVINIILVASAAAVSIKPTTGPKASVDMLDNKRQDHTDKIVDHLKERIFNVGHDSLDHYHEGVMMTPSYNNGDKEPTEAYPYPARNA